MSTVGSSDATTQPNGIAVPPSEPAGNSGGIDPRLIQETKNEIRGLVQEITQLSQSDIPPDRFYEEFLRRVVQALASHGGAFWSIGEQGTPKLEYQINMPAEELVDRPEPRKRHILLLKNMLETGQPTLVPPHSGSADLSEAGNATEFLLVLANVSVDKETRGIIEIFQRPGGGPTTQRGYLRFLVQMSELAAGFLKSRRLRQLGSRQTLWESLEQFLELIHRRLDVQETAFTLVNESRRLIGCDRVSVTVQRGRQQHVLAISSLDSLDRRADQVQRLRELATAVSRARKPVWYGDGTIEMPPQIEEPLQAYVDRSHATMLAVVPLFPAPAEPTSDKLTARRDEQPIGTLIVEQLEDSHFHPGFRERVETVARHGGTALANAVAHESLFLLPLWRALGRSRCVVEARHLPKSIAALALIISIVLGLAFVTADFKLVAEGRLQPADRRDVFVHMDGVVVEVLVDHEQIVQEREVLARLTNSELEVEIANLHARQATTRERIRSVKRSQLHVQSRIEEQDRLDGELLELEQTALGLDSELALLNDKLEQLLIRSPMDGQVVTWNVRELLEGRPVRIGQSLLTVVDPAGSWELELEVPERKMGHLARALADQDRAVPVTFVLASHPEHEFTGQIIEIDRIAEVRAGGQNSVRVRVAIDMHLLPELRGGTTVTGKVLCGRRSVGYVLFHELFETIQRQRLLWM